MLNEIYRCDGQGGPQPPPGEPWKPGDKPEDKKPDQDEQEEKQSA